MFLVGMLALSLANLIAINRLDQVSFWPDGRLKFAYLVAGLLIIASLVSTVAKARGWL